MVAPNNRPCPSRDELQAYCLGLLPDPALDTVASHVADCSICSETLPEVQNEVDSVVAQLRGVDQRMPYAQERECRQLARRAKDLWQEMVPPPTLSVGEPTPQAVETVVDVDARRGESVTQDHVPADEPLPETIGQYRIVRLLGRGGFGCVYLGYNAHLRRYAAIKLPRADRTLSPAEKQLLLQEAQAAANLKHPGIVAIYEVGWLDDGRLFIAMEYIEGRTLAQVMAEGRMPPEQAAELIAKVADAVHYAHKRGLVHRDLKPGNILIDQEGQPHVADFGLAVHEDAQRRHAGQIAGTPAYMSPEQVRGDVHLLDGRTDIWSLGVILYELLTGRRPFSGSREQMFDEILHRDPKPLRQINDRLPAELECVCLECLRKAPAQRPLTASDVSSRLRAAHQRRSYVWLGVVVIGVAATLLLLFILYTLYVKPGHLRSQSTDDWRKLALDAATTLTGDAEVVKDYDPQKGELHVSARSHCLLSLGATREGAWRLRATFVVDRSSGKGAYQTGVFFGFRKVGEAKNPQRFRAQTVSVLNNPDFVQLSRSIKRYELDRGTRSFGDTPLALNQATPRGHFPVPRVVARSRARADEGLAFTGVRSNCRWGMRRVPWGLGVFGDRSVRTPASMQLHSPPLRQG